MNILHHKSWHVRNKDNIQRVKRDEAKAADEEKERLKRQSIAESEARLDILRGRSSSSLQQKSDPNPNDPITHINLFESEEKGGNNDEKNKDAELEKKEEKEKFEKKVGLLKYMVDEKDLDLITQPWYKKIKKYDNEKDKDLEVDLKQKHINDPLTDMKGYLKERDKAKKNKSHKHKHDEKYTESKKSKKHKSLLNNDEPEVKKSKNIEELRAERLKRENEARAKTNSLLYGNKEETKEKIEVDDRKRRYNNQFNPEMSRY